MSLGVLNNLSAVYAENYLNNTNSSLNTVLQQLSSGSKINSGADDAAGLSLVNGLQANQQALNQSETNASEGVGLLQVADGALSQVTSLLNRAVTLATEASNGTLDSSQDTAANQEYQSILSEINNIGTTTTYNDTSVFGQASTNIYTGDSSSAGSSVDSLDIRSLSSSNVGDTAGVMSYNNGQSNAFLNLSNSTTNAAITDSLNASGSTSINVNYLTQGNGGTAVTANATITVGTGTNYSNTAQGLIQAINGSGLGLNATFATAAQAGTEAASGAAGSGSQTGILITGQGIGAGTSAGEIGSLTVASAGDALSGTLNIVGANGTTHAITLGTTGSTDTIANLANTINSAGYGVTASVNSATLTFTSANSAVTISGANIQDQGAASSSNVTWAAGSPTIGVAGAVGTLTAGAATDVLTAGTFNVTGINGTATTFALGGTGTGAIDNITQLAAAINTYATANAGFGVTASVNAAGTVMTLAQAAGGAQNAVAGAATAALAPVNLGVVPTWTAGGAIGAKSAGTLGTLTVGNATSLLSGTLSVTGDLSATALVLNLGTNGTTDNMADLYNTLTTTDAATLTTDGLTVTLSSDHKTLTFGQVGSGTNNSAATGPAAGAATLGTLTVDNANDTLSGTLNAIGSIGTLAALNLATFNSNGTGTLSQLYTYLTSGAEATALANAGLSVSKTSSTELTFSQVSASATQNGSLSATNLAAASTANVLTGATVQSDSMANVPSTAAQASTVAGSSLGTLSITGGGQSTDTFSAGALYITGANGATTAVSATGDTLAQLASTINGDKLGVNATANGTTLTFTTAGADSQASVSLETAFTDNSNGNATVTLAPASNTPPNPQYYSVGLSSTNGVNDSTTSVTVGDALHGNTNRAFLTDNNGSAGIATIGYSDSAGANLSASDLSNQGDAQTALNALNSAITDVAAQDGYIGAQINTLNAVSSVLSTQSENVQAAQNAVQSTDYAMATSNMSKYEILSQTGIAALAQANSQQQEVLKLLQ
jgi:flagellin